MPYDLTKARRAIRAECTKQGIDDDARRAMMQRLAGVTSSTDLDADGARRVLDPYIERAEDLLGEKIEEILA